ncbi:hypothetical protein ACN469_05715 [Corallococcus terminator]
MSSPLRHAASALRHLAIAVRPRPEPSQPAGVRQTGTATSAPLQQALKGHSTFEPLAAARGARGGDPSADDGSPTSPRPSGGPPALSSGAASALSKIRRILERLFPSVFPPPGTARSDPSADPDSPSSSRGMANGENDSYQQAVRAGPQRLASRKTPDCGADDSSPQSAKGSGHRDTPGQILR